MKIRPAVLEDADALMAIYNPAVLTSTATFDLVPRTLQQQRDWISDRSGARFVLVAVDDDDGSDDDGESAGSTVYGFAAISPYRDRAAYSTTVEDSVYIDQDHQGHGVGGLLLDALIDTARAHGFHSMVARIVSGHEASIALHSKCGFEIIGHEREVGRKFGRWLDVIVMQKLL